MHFSHQRLEAASLGLTWSSEGFDDAGSFCSLALVPGKGAVGPELPIPWSEVAMKLQLAPAAVLFHQVNI